MRPLPFAAKPLTAALDLDGVAVAPSGAPIAAATKAVMSVRDAAPGAGAIGAKPVETRPHRKPIVVAAAGPPNDGPVASAGEARPVRV